MAQHHETIPVHIIHDAPILGHQPSGVSSGVDPETEAIAAHHIHDFGCGPSDEIAAALNPEVVEHPYVIHSSRQ
jgi:hypothetical protein